MKACCATAYNSGRIGGVQHQSIADVWGGRRLAEQRRALEAGRFDLGCQECELAIAAGGRSASLAASFDRYDAEPAPFPRFLDLALSNRCNLQCVMCNGELSSAIRGQREHREPMAPAYDEAFFAELIANLHHVERFHFKGGEPFLARENRRVWDALIEQDLHPEILVTTNGTTWNDDVERYVRTLQMHPVISVDAVSEDLIGTIRVGVDHATLWQNIDRFRAVSDETGAGMSMSICIMTTNWHEIGALFGEADRRGIFVSPIFVNQPLHFDLLRLPPDELAAVSAQMDAASPTFTLDHTRDQWTGILDRLHAQLVHRRELQIDVASADAVTDPGPSFDQLVESLTEWSGDRPLIVTISAGKVTSVESTPWADWLVPTTWVGAREHDILTSIERAFGQEVDFDAVMRPDRALELVTRVALPEGEHLARVLSPSEPGSVQRFLLSMRPVRDES